MGGRREQVSIRLRPATLEALDALGEDLDRSRTWLIEHAVKAMLAEEQDG